MENRGGAMVVIWCSSKYGFLLYTHFTLAIGLIANLEYRGKIYCKMFKNTDWRGETKPIMAQLPFLHSTNIPQA